jgi:hypothetical protein
MATEERGAENCLPGVRILTGFCPARSDTAGEADASATGSIGTPIGTLALGMDYLF